MVEDHLPGYSDWLSVPEISRALDVSSQTIYRWIGKGLLGSIKEGPPKLVKKGAINRLIEGEKSWLLYWMPRGGGVK